MVNIIVGGIFLGIIALAFSKTRKDIKENKCSCGSSCSSSKNCGGSCH
ncbi:MAG: FeoB-associated Cys-rich membrane protein [Firmicutes bacterium]|jgi:hypothetical protein|nr:FeoB-associated Cys-rich membrane protein [Bacillota bacterium]